MSTSSTFHDPESLAVCPQCCHANLPEHHFGESCNTPHSSMAAILPAWRPWAEGYLIRRAVRRADSWLVLIGMWLIFAPSVILPVLLWADMPPWQGIAEDWMYGSRPSAVIGAVLQLFFLGGGLALVGSILFLTTRSFYQNRRREHVDKSQE